MISRAEYPILEFDDCKVAKINPSMEVSDSVKGNIPERCVITFFREVIADMLSRGLLVQVSKLPCETVVLPLYKTMCGETPVCLIQGFVGAVNSAAMLEELIAHGIKRFIVCGGAGVLQKGIQVGHLVVPYAAIRDEGVSYHYIAPSREIECDPAVVESIERALTRRGIPYIRAKTWTTDAPYRETEEKIALRVSEGCVTVEMEASAFFAVSRFRSVKLGQIIYGGDDLSGVEWDKRLWHDRKSIRANLTELSLQICAEL
jgi:uridine phosphorylase